MTFAINMKTALLSVSIVLGMIAQTKPTLAADTATLTVAGGCFWCVEADFEKVKGVKASFPDSQAALFQTRPTNRSQVVAQVTTKRCRSNMIQASFRQASFTECSSAQSTQRMPVGSSVTAERAIAQLSLRARTNWTPLNKQRLQHNLNWVKNW